MLTTDLPPEQMARVEKYVHKIEAYVSKAHNRFQQDYLLRSWAKPNAADGFKATINLHILSEAIWSAAVDLERWAHFHISGHESEGPDRHKLAGFSAKWISHFRPICFEAPQDYDYKKDIEAPNFLHLNAIFSFYVLRSFLIFDVQHNTLVLDKLERELLYRLQFRCESGENLALLAYCYEAFASLPEA